MDLITGFLAVSGLYFFISQAELFGVMSRIRNILFRIPKVGPFFYEMFQCPFCLGYWCSLFTYLFLSSPRPSVILWCFAGAAFNWIIYRDIE